MGTFIEKYRGKKESTGGGVERTSVPAEKETGNSSSFIDKYEGGRIRRAEAERARKEAERARKEAERARKEAEREAEKRRAEEEAKRKAEEERRRYPLRGAGIAILQEGQRRKAEAEEKRSRLPLKGTGIGILNETYKQQKAIETELRSRKYPLKSQDGMYFGDVSYDAMRAIQRGKIDEYLSADMDEANAIRGFKTWAERKARKERISSNPVFERYGIDPLYFNRAALDKWAKEHHMGWNNQTDEEILVSLREGGFLGIGGKNLASDQEINDSHVLHELAKNNERKKAAGKDLGGWQSALYSFVDSTSFGLLSSSLYEDAERGMYEYVGLPKEDFVGTSQSMAKTLNENKVASFGGNVAGILLPAGIVSKGAQAALGTIKGFGKLAPWAQNAIADAITFGSMGGTRTAIAGGDAGDIAADTFRGALGGAAGSFARSATDYGLTKLFTSPKVAGKWWTKAKDNVSTYYAKNIVAGLADSGGEYVGDTVAALATGRETMSKEELLGDMAVAFIFGTMQNASSSKEVSGKSKAALENEFIKYAEDYKALDAAAKKARSAEGFTEIGEALIQRGEALKQTLEGTMFPGQKDAVKNMSEWIDTANDGIRKKISEVTGKASKGTTGEAGVVKTYPVATGADVGTYNSGVPEAARPAEVEAFPEKRADAENGTKIPRSESPISELQREFYRRKLEGDKGSYNDYMSQKLDDRLRTVALADVAENGRQAFDAVLYDPTVAEADAFVLAYNESRFGDKPDAEQRTQVEALAPEVRTAAVEAGKADAEIATAKVGEEKTPAMEIETAPVREEQSPSPADDVEIVKGITPGFVKSEFSSKIGNKTLRALDAIGKKLGVEITIGEPTGKVEGAYNGKYENGRITIAQDAENPLAVVLAHDITHHLKRTAPAEYGKFVEMAVENSERLSGLEKTELIERYRIEYSEGKEFSDTKAIDEITADYAGKIVNDVGLFKKLVNADKNLAQRFIESIKRFIAKVKSVFSFDKSKMDTAAMEKYGTTVEGLEKAVKQYESMLDVTADSVKSGTIENTAGRDADGVEYSVKENAKGKYVQADRKVVEGKNPKEWGESVERFINDKIRQGEDVQVLADNGDILTITENSAGKAKFRNYVIRPDGTKTRMTDAEYLTKLNAESHIDELSKISKKGKKDVPDYKRHDFAKDGFNYRTAYFQDGDGKYYKLTISVGKNGEINTVYNVGKIEEAPFPLMAHRPDTKSVGGNKASFNDSIPDSFEKSNTEFSRKTGDLLSRDYKPPVRRDNPSTASGPPPFNKGGTENGAGDDSYIEDTGLDEYFDENRKIANPVKEVDTDEIIEDPEKAKDPKISKSWLARKFLNSANTTRKIAKATKDEFLYPALNRARSSSNSIPYMLSNKQTDIRGKEVGESLGGVLSPIKKKGKEHFNKFHLYLLYKHNADRMSIHDATAEELARAERLEFAKRHPEIANMSEKELKEAGKKEDNIARLAREYERLQEKVRKTSEKNKPIFFNGESLPKDPTKSRALAEKMLRENPEFAEVEGKLRKYIDNLMQRRVDTKLITQEDADYFRKKYPNYIPTYRNTEDAWKQISGDISIGKTVKKAKGGEEKLLPLDVALAWMTKKVIRNGDKNMFANKLFDDYENNKDTVGKYITDVKEGALNAEEQIEEFGEGKKIDNTVKFYREGRNVELTVTPELFETFDILSGAPKENPKVLRRFAKFVEFRKKFATTWKITFAPVNALKDIQDALVNTRDAKAFVKNYPRAYAQILSNGEMWKMYQAIGGLYSSELEEIRDKGIEVKNSKIEKAAGAIPYLNTMVEQAPRLAEFMSVVEKGDINDIDTLNDALLAAAEVTVNFGESGSITKVLNKYWIPFLNPAIQGTAQTVRTFTRSRTGKEWLGFIAKSAGIGLTVGFINDLFNGDDEDYENLDERTKDNYYLFGLGDGEFLKIPKGRVIASLGVVADRIKDAIKGEDVDVRAAASQIAKNVLPENPLNNTIFKAMMDADLFDEESPGKTWYGEDIENDRLQGLPVGERYDNDTDYISRWVGEKFGLSPKKLNYVIDQYFSGGTDVVFPAITPSQQDGDTPLEKLWGGFKGVWKSSFTIDAKTQNKVSGEFYDAVTKAEQAKNSKDATTADKIIWKHLNRERNMMSGYNTKIRDAEVDENLTSKERNAAVRAASAERTAYQKTVLENLPKYRSEVEKYLKKYPGKDEEKRIDFAYREANRAMYGAEYAIRASGGADVYKKALEKVNRGKTTWDSFYDEYFGKTERQYEAISKRFDVSYDQFEAIENVISKNSKKEDEITAIAKLGYKRGEAEDLREVYNEAGATSKQTSAPYSIKNGGKEYVLGDAGEKYSETREKIITDLSAEFQKNRRFKGLSEEAQKSILADFKSYATDKAKEEYFNGQNVKYERNSVANKADKAKRQGTKISDFYIDKYYEDEKKQKEKEEREKSRRKAIEREIGKISDDRFYEIKQAMANSTKEEEIEALRDMGYSKRRAEKIREKYNKTK